MIRRALRDFFGDERASVSIMAVGWIPLTLAMGGLAVDTVNAMRVRTQLQAVADAAAHAALYTRETQDTTMARAAARAIVETSLPAARNGEVIRDADIVFGTWDAEAESFTPDETSRDAVMIDLARAADRNNSVGTWLLRFAGVDSWDVRRGAVFETYQPSCLRQGYTADGIVDIQSNNDFYNGFCVHSNIHVEANSNNSFEIGTTVSMPDQTDLVIPISGWSSNIGLAEALRDDEVGIRILGRLPQVIEEVGTYGTDRTPGYITSSSVVTLPSKNADQSHFIPGVIHVFTCGSNDKLHIGSGTVLRNLVLTTNCPIILGNGTILENAVIATTNTSAGSIDAANGVQIGRDDNCATGGGAQVLTLGSVKVAAGLGLFGGQIIAADDVSFAANANGVEGASIIAGGTISGTSNATMGLCDGGMEQNIEAQYFRLAR